MYIRKVLYIENDGGDIKRMQKGIDKNKFEIIGEIYGDKAIKRIKEDEHRSIKAILLDIDLKNPKTKLPQKLQGNAIASKIKEITPEMPIIALSKKGIINVAIAAYYPKEVLFEDKDRRTFKDLEDALDACIDKVEEKMYYPNTAGKQWSLKWGKKYIEFMNNPKSPIEEKEIGSEALKDINLLDNMKIKNTYRRFRGTDTLWNVLIARRVIFAVFFNYEGDWGKVGNLLMFAAADEKLEENDIPDGLRNFMNACGIAWGAIANRGTLLREEVNWLIKEDYLSS